MEESFSFRHHQSLLYDGYVRKVHLERRQDSLAKEDRSPGPGRDGHRRFRFPRRYKHRSFHHVSFRIGELLEEWTHKKSVGDLARTMSLNVGSVWLKQADGQEVQISANDVKLDDQLVIHMGTVIPFDGTVVAGEGYGQPGFPDR